ncbi:MarR family winged helix-turn-helix transcriptional regulator [Pontivivens insulae]|uniref:Organic hydroperoxide resistance transcriptional regulator n=1 Tax=Pontivivens insulae TaxID=1639689 RepID=A0A2R8AAE9_9RHOB|nr:MarR family transcriptional regulator [Pontivivens insulae]RED13135.1 DNA-binding MarR family transcriptional regulator [Pontivivens insulae]SPF29227.1 Organic hydroperoxide resistance transcriptional regulator [Pontivivens insulae]
MISVSEMICFSLYNTGQAMQQAYRPLLDALNLTYPQYLVMTLLWSKDQPLTVGQIGAALGMETSTLTPLLKRLESNGLIQRRRMPEDERRVAVTLSEAGQALKAKAAIIPDCIAQQTGMTVEELGQLRDQLARLSDNLRDPVSRD